MARVRTVQRAREVGDVTVVKSSTVAGMRQLRCPKCQGMATPAKDHTGREVFACMACGTKFTSRRI